MKAEYLVYEEITVHYFFPVTIQLGHPMPFLSYCYAKQNTDQIL